MMRKRKLRHVAMPKIEKGGLDQYGPKHFVV